MPCKLHICACKEFQEGDVCVCPNYIPTHAIPIQKTFEQVFNEHIEWTDKVFPLSTATGALFHLRREAKEVINEIEALDMDREALVIEFADMWGCISSSMKKQGITFE